MSDVVLKTIIAEAGGDPAAMAAVAAVIHNRAVAQGKTPEQIVKARGQFEGYSNPGPASIRAQNDPKVVARASKVWSGVKSGTIADPTNGATQYHADYITPYWAKSANTNGTVNIGGNIFYKGSKAPSTALAAINDAVAPNPQSRPPALGYAQTPASVRAITVNPDGSPASLLDALTAKYGSATQTPRGASGLSVSGIPLPEAMPVQRPSVPSLPSLTSRKVNSVPINPVTGNPYTGVELAQQAANTEAARLRGSIPAGRVANIPPIPQPVQAQPKAAQALPEPKVTFTNGIGGGKQTAFNQANQQAVINNLPFGIGAAATGLGTLANMVTPKPTPVTAVAAAPKPIVPAPVLTNQPTEAQLRAIRAVPPSIPAQVYTKVQTPGYTPVAGGQAVGRNAIGKDVSQLTTPSLAYTPSPPKPPGVAAITAATTPVKITVPYGSTAPAFNAGTWGSGGLTTRFPIPPPITYPSTVAQQHVVRRQPVQHPLGGILGSLFTPTADPAGLGPGPFSNMANVNAPINPPPGASFLNAQGVETSSMSAGQIQNALMDAINGKQRGSFGAGNSN